MSGFPSPHLLIFISNDLICHFDTAFAVRNLLDLAGQ
jgi:hypothetical protein